MKIRVTTAIAGLCFVLTGPLQARGITPHQRHPEPAGQGVAGQALTQPWNTNGVIVAVYAIQVGAFAEVENARKLAALLRSKGFNAVIYENLIDGKRLLHLVWVGRFDRPDDAQPELERIEKLTGIRGVLREQMIWRKK